MVEMEELNDAINANEQQPTTVVPTFNTICGLGPNVTQVTPQNVDSLEPDWTSSIDITPLEKASYECDELYSTIPTATASSEQKEHDSQESQQRVVGDAEQENKSKEAIELKQEETIVEKEKEEDIPVQEAPTLIEATKETTEETTTNHPVQPNEAHTEEPTTETQSAIYDEASSDTQNKSQLCIPPAPIEEKVEEEAVEVAGEEVVGEEIDQAEATVVTTSPAGVELVEEEVPVVENIEPKVDNQNTTNAEINGEHPLIVEAVTNEEDVVEDQVEVAGEEVIGVDTEKEGADEISTAPDVEPQVDSQEESINEQNVELENELADTGRGETEEKEENGLEQAATTEAVEKKVLEEPAEAESSKEIVEDEVQNESDKIPEPLEENLNKTEETPVVQLSARPVRSTRSRASMKPSSPPLAPSEATSKVAQSEKKPSGRKRGARQNSPPPTPSEPPSKIRRSSIRQNSPPPPPPPPPPPTSTSTEQPSKVTQSEKKPVKRKRGQDNEESGLVAEESPPRIQPPVKISLRPMTSVKAANNKPALPSRISEPIHLTEAKLYECKCGFTTSRLNNLVFHKKTVDRCPDFGRFYKERVDSYIKGIQSPKKKREYTPKTKMNLS